MARTSISVYTVYLLYLCLIWVRRSVSMRSYVVYVYVGVWEGASAVISSLAAIVSNVLRWRGWNEVGFFACVVSTLESLLFACMFLVYNLSSRKQSNEHSRQSVCYTHYLKDKPDSPMSPVCVCVYMGVGKRERVWEWVSEWEGEWVSTTPASYSGHSQFYHVAHCVLASHGYKDNALCHLVEYSPTTHCNNCGVSGEISGWGSCPKKPPVSYSWGIMC